jgi:hypothetical protein
MDTIVKNRSHKAVERLTERQIKKRVGEAWALLENPEFNEKEVMLSAELLYYNADRNKVHEEVMKYRGIRKNGGHFAVFFFGTPDPNVVYLL